MDDNNNSEVQLLEFELEQARQDDRDATNQFWQAVAVGVAAIAFILALYSQLENAGGGNVIPAPFYLLLTAFVSIAVFSYSAAIAIRDAVRYQYIRHIENRLRELTDATELRWKQVISPVETLNIHHLTSIVSVAHYCNTLFAIGFAILSCVLIAALFYTKLGSTTVLVLGMLAYLPFGAVFILTFALSTTHSREMYEYAVKQADERIRNELNPHSSEKEMHYPRVSLLYFFYPRPMDVLKVLFILYGMVLCLSLGGTVANTGFWSYLIAGLTCIFVFDVLVYQARYQWNDIREITEDDKAPQAERRRRLAKTGLPLRVDVVISLTVMAYKLILALAILIMNWNTFGTALAVCCVLVFIFAVPYEHARAVNNASAVIAQVPFGYPLRIAAGFVTFASISSRNDLLAIAKANALGLSLVACATFVFGITFVGITWALAGFDWHDKNESGVCPKAHLEKLYLAIGDKKQVDKEMPLAKRGNVLAPWNIAMIFAAIGMSAAALTSSTAGLSTYACGLLLLCVGIRILAGWNRVLWLLPIAAATTCALAWLFPALFASYGIQIGRAAAGYLLGGYVFFIIYAWFRELNYERMNDPLRDIREFIQRIKPAVLVAFFGENTAKLLYSISSESAQTKH